MKQRIITALLAVALVCALLPCGALAAEPGLSNFTRSNTYTDGQFTDVPASAWYAGDVRAAYEYGLMTGKSGNTFDPDGTVRISEALALACRLHSLYQGNGGTFTPSNPWYHTYVNYAQANGILPAGGYASYNAYATRAQFAVLLANAFPEAALTPINTIQDGALPDVPMTMDGAAQIYRLYRAGILTGNDQAGTFTPNANIQRSAVAAIVTRMASAEDRQTFTLVTPPPANVTRNQLVEAYNKMVDSWDTGENDVILFSSAALKAETARVLLSISNSRENERKRSDALQEMRDNIDKLLPSAKTILAASNEYPSFFADIKALSEKMVSELSTLRALSFTKKEDYDFSVVVRERWSEIYDAMCDVLERIDAMK